MKVPAWFAAGGGLAAPAAVCRGRPISFTLSIAVAPDVATLYAFDRTAGCVTILDRAAGKWAADMPFPGEPWDWPGVDRRQDAVCVAARGGRGGGGRYGQGAVEQVLPVGPWPAAWRWPRRANGSRYGRGDHTVAVVDLSTGRSSAGGRDARPVRRRRHARRAPDGRDQYLPQGAGTDPTLAAGSRSQRRRITATGESSCRPARRQ